MAKKKRQKKEKVVHPSVTESAPVEQEVSTSEFPSAKRISIISACTVIFILLVLSLASVNGLQFLKRLILVFAGVDMPSMVAQPYTSWDMAIWLCLGGTVVGGALIHPALGIAALLMFRPWVDGYTFMGDNAYYLWAVLFITVVWGARQLLQGQALRAKTATLLLLGFLFAGLIATLNARSYGDSLRELLLWAVYFCLFIVTVNGLRTEKTRRIVMWSLVLVLAGEAIYAVLHFKFLLTYLRQELMTNAEFRQENFGTDVLSAELIHRINRNRAFGSTLFPNALAGFLLLGIPVTLALAVEAWWKFLPLRKAEPEPVADWRTRRYQAIFWGGSAWTFVTILFYCIFLYPTMFFRGPSSFFASPVAIFIEAAVLGIFTGLAVGVSYDRLGPRPTWWGVAAFLLPILLIVQLWALLLSYSRGGWLSLVLASATGIVLYRMGARDTTPLLGKLPRWLAPACIVLLAAVLFVSTITTPEALAQDSTSEETTTEEGLSSQELMELGSEITVSDLADPSTFRIRLVYWGVGLEMFKSAPWTGVGLANFASAYANFQGLEDEPVRNAHNGYLQAFCETGVLGGVLLSAFWMWFVIWGGLRVLAEKAKGKRLLLAGVFTAAFAFAGHAFIDIHFTHPGMMMVAIVLVGLFYALATQDVKTQASPTLKWQLAAMPMLLLAALLFGFSVRTYLRDAAMSRASVFDIASDKFMNNQFAMLRFFASGDQQFAYVNSAIQLIPDSDLLNGVGKFYEPIDSTRVREIPEGEVLPPNAVISLTRKPQARQLALDWGNAWAENYARADAHFPQDAGLAAFLVNWYEALSRYSEGGSKKRYAEEMLEWSRKAVERNSSMAQNYELLGDSLWRLGQIEGGPEGETMYKEAIQVYAQARDHLPSFPVYYRLLSERAGELAKAYEDTAAQFVTDAEGRKKYEDSAALYRQIESEAAEQRLEIRAARAEYRRKKASGS